MKRFSRQLLALSLAIVCLCPVVTAAVSPAPAAAIQVVPVQAAGFFGRLISSLLKRPQQEENTPAQTAPAANTSGDYEGPVDFEALKMQNPDIYAWIDIPDSDVSYPILRSPNDNAYYLTHDSLKKKNTKGALFTEDYNTMTFDDPMTVIYGHTTRDGSLFGKLQENYSSKEYFDAHRTIKIYLPDREYTYKVFAAVPFGNEHILYYYNMWAQTDHDLFYSKIFGARTLTGNVDEDAEIKLGDRVIALSTCIASDRSKRFLVLAVRETENK